MSNRINIPITENEGLPNMDMPSNVEAQAGPADIEPLMEKHMTNNFDLNKIKKVSLVFRTSSPDHAVFEPTNLSTTNDFVMPSKIHDSDKSIDQTLSHFSQNTTVQHAKHNTAVVKEKRGDHDVPLHFNESIFIKQNYRYHKITYEDILFLKADRNHTYVFTINRSYLIRHSIQSLISGLVNAAFIIRVHRSFAINMRHLSSFNETTAIIASEEIPIGPNYRQQFLNVFTT